MKISQMGFYGKIPAEGDFVSRSLPAPVVDKLDNWMMSLLVAMPAEMAAWSRAERPLLLCFAAPAGTVSPEPCMGLFTLLHDRVGRVFPLMFVATLTVAGEPSESPGIEDFLLDLGDVVYLLRDGLAIPGLQECLQRLVQRFNGGSPPVGKGTPFHVMHALLTADGVRDDTLWIPCTDGLDAAPLHCQGLPAAVDLRRLM